MSIENPEFNNQEPEPEPEPKIEEIDLKELKKGDKIVVKTGENTIYEIIIIGKEKGSVKVKIKESSYSVKDPEKPKVEEWTARMPGGFEMDRVEDVDDDRIRAVTKEGVGLMKDTIKSGGEYTLYFENIKDLDGQRLARNIRTEPVSEILEVGRQSDKKDEK